MELSQHIPVLSDEVIEGLNLSPGDNVIDATVGGGGHAKAILERISPNGKLLGIDLDPSAIALAKERLKKYGNRATLKTGNYAQIEKIAHESRIGAVSAVLLDLGLSSDQIKDPARGFSFSSEGPLDMRFSDQAGTTAYEIVNAWPENDLEKIFREYGEERRAARAARNIIAARRRAPIRTAKNLAEVVMRGAGKHGRIHPATLIFQALRITANRELDNLNAALPDMVDLLRKNGRLAVISFHSLEDRIAKQFFRSKARDHNPAIRLINKKVIKPSRKEVLSNPSSRSAKLRIIEKIQ